MTDISVLVERIGQALLALSLPQPVIGFGGAHAKGLADALSDVDFYVFADAWPAPCALAQRIGQILPDATELKSWASDTECGVDFSLDGHVVEVWFRQSKPVLDGAERALAGAVEREDRVWTPNGFYRYAALADLSSMAVLHCQNRDFAEALERIRLYPLALRRAAFAHGMQALEFWRGNMHLETAIERVDAYYLQSIAHQIRTGLLHAAFAANGKYFGGDKKMRQALGQLALPRGFAEDVLQPWPGEDGTSAQWRDVFERLFAAGRGLTDLQA